jgi:hypothetical protein
VSRSLISSEIFDTAVLAAAIGSFIGLLVAVAYEFILARRAERQLVDEARMRRGFREAARRDYLPDDIH